jgi:hypothetical protein
MIRGVSAVSWLDTDDAETRRVRDVLAALADRETVDSLGLGPIRDGFADALFPGTSTVQTRLRYFLIVPWTCRVLEAARPDRRTFDARLRRAEHELIETLRDTMGPNQGVIGYRSRGRTNRLPSSVYWHGLGAWGILRRADLSFAAYRDVATGRRGAAVIGDDEDLPDGSSNVWDPDLPDPPADWPEGASLAVGHAEAAYLLERAGRTRLGLGGATEPSLLACLAGTDGPWLDAPDPWTIPVQEPRVAEVLGHARNFSLVAHGAQLLYNRLLAVDGAARLGADTSDLTADLDERLAGWADTVAADPALVDWWNERDRFWATVAATGARVRLDTRAFVERWVRESLIRPHELAKLEPIQRQVTEHEHALKGRYARLSNLSALQNWNGNPLGDTRLTYRWPTVQRLLGDLRDGRTGSGDAGA